MARKGARGRAKSCAMHFVGAEDYCTVVSGGNKRKKRVGRRGWGVRFGVWVGEDRVCKLDTETEVVDRVRDAMAESFSLRH